MKDGSSIIENLIEQYAQSFNNFDSGIDTLKSWDNEDLTPFVVKFDDDSESLLYFLLVRILRICDQKSFEMKECS